MEHIAHNYKNRVRETFSEKFNLYKMEHIDHNYKNRVRETFSEKFNLQKESTLITIIKIGSERPLVKKI